MNGYESVFILNPSATEEAQNKLLDKVTQVVENNGGKVVHKTTWGRRRMAFPIKKQIYGNYHLFYLNRAPAALKEMETQFRYSDEVLAWQSVAVNDINTEYEAFEKLKSEGSLSQKITER